MTTFSALLAAAVLSASVAKTDKQKAKAGLWTAPVQITILEDFSVDEEAVAASAVADAKRQNNELQAVRGKVFALLNANSSTKLSATDVVTQVAAQILEDVREEERQAAEEAGEEYTPRGIFSLVESKFIADQVQKVLAISKSSGQLTSAKGRSGGTQTASNAAAIAKATAEAAMLAKLTSKL